MPTSWSDGGLHGGLVLFIAHTVVFVITHGGLALLQVVVLAAVSTLPLFGFISRGVLCIRHFFGVAISITAQKLRACASFAHTVFDSAALVRPLDYEETLTSTSLTTGFLPSTLAFVVFELDRLCPLLTFFRVC